MNLSPLDRSILRLALPSIVSNITVPLLGLCDVAIVGHLGSATYIAAIAVGSMIFNTMYWLLGFLRMGTSGLTSQALGARRFDEVSRRLCQGVLLGFLLGLLLVSLQWPLRLVTFYLMQPTAEVEVLAIPYFQICIFGAPAMLGLYALTGWLVGMQNTRLPMCVAIGQNVVNVLVSFILVFVLHWGISGVAAGTLIAQWAGFIFAVVMTMRHYRANRLWRWLTGSDSVVSGLTRFFVINRDIFLRTLCLVIVNFYFTSCGAAQGAMVLAANTLLLQLYLLFSYVSDGFAYAGEALSGRYLGSGNTVGLQCMMRRLFGWGGALALLFSLGYAISGTQLLSLLTTEQEVISIADSYLPWVTLVPLCGIAAFLFDGIFIGLTATRGMLLSSFIAMLCFFVTWLLLRQSLGNHALWLAQLVYLSMRGLVQWLLITHGTCRLNV